MPSMSLTHDSGYAILSNNPDFFSHGLGDYDNSITKIDKSGNIEWVKVYGELSNDIGRSIVQTKDSGFIVTGESNNDLMLYKTDKFGRLLWFKKYGGPYSDEGNDVVETSDGYLVVGCTHSFGSSGDIYIIKTNTVGDTLWTRVLGSYDYDAAYSVIKLNNSDFAVCGWSGFSLSLSSDACILKIDGNGNLKWFRSLGGVDIDAFMSILKTSDNGFLLAGYSENIGAGDVDVLIVKTDSSGDVEWSKAYGDSMYDGIGDLIESYDGGYIMVGYSASLNYSPMVIKIDSVGNLLWTRTYSEYLSILSIFKTKDGGYITCGEYYDYSLSRNYSALMKTDNQFNSICFGLQANLTTTVLNLSAVTESPYQTTAGSYNALTISDSAYVAISIDCISVLVKENSPINEFEIFPNPVDDIIRFEGLKNPINEVIIFDLMGKKINSAITYENDQLTISNIQDGIYMLRVQTDNAFLTKKFIKNSIK